MRTTCQCGRNKPNPAHIVCAPCWGALPIPLRANVILLNRRKCTRGTPDHVAAVRECLQWLRAHDAAAHGRPSCGQSA